MFTVTWGYLDDDGRAECGCEAFDSQQEAEVFYWEGVQEIIGNPVRDVYWSSLRKDGEILRYWDHTNIGATLVW